MSTYRLDFAVISLATMPLAADWGHVCTARRGIVAVELHHRTAAAHPDAGSTPPWSIEKLIGNLLDMHQG
jgi:hypothetical protein